MIRVGFDATTLLVRNKTGVERYVENLLKHMVEQLEHSRDVDLFLYMHVGNPYADPALKTNYSDFWRNAHVVEHSWSRGYNLFLPTRAGLDRLHLLHVPGLYSPRFDVCPLLVTCHHVSWLGLPAEGLEVEGLRGKETAERAFRRSAAVIADSNNTKEDVIDLGLKSHDKVWVAYLGVDERFRPRPDAKEIIAEKYALGPYILNVAALQYRKNQVRLLQAYAQLVSGAGIPHDLVIAGRDGWGSDEVYSERDRLGLGDRVRFLGFVPDEDLPLLYAAADLVVYPSLYEGFGLPLLEAMACGTVVAAANTSCLPEIGGPAALYFDPHDVSAIANSIHTGLTDVVLRQDLRAAASKHIGAFTWQETARQTLKVYREVVEK